MISSIILELFSIIALCFTICMAERHVIENKNNINYLAASITTIILLILEISTVLMEPLHRSEWAIPNRIANILGFSLSPAVPYILLLFSRKGKRAARYTKILEVPLYLNALACILSYKTGWIFSVSSQNYYTRGNLFLLPIVVSMFYYALMIKSAFKNSAEYENSDRKILILIVVLPVLAAVLQILYRDLLLTWNSAALSLLLYYIFLRELQFTYDIQTGVKNRAAFEKEMEQYVTNNKSATIFMLDLNSLKETNDVYGHKAGDELILSAAKAIRKCFLGIGKTYRIGGDEFCVICGAIPKQSAEDVLTNLDNLLVEVNQTRENKISIAYGYAFHNKKKSESIYSVLSRADRAMYIHKAKLKGRRRMKLDSL